MALIPYPSFCGETYLAASPVIDASRAINLYPELELPSSKGQVALIGRPGLSAGARTYTLGSTPVRALWAGNNRLFAVSGTHFYELNPAGGVITDYGAMAGSGGTGPAYIKGNGTQLLVCDPSAGKVYNAAGGIMTAVFNGIALEYLDGFFVSIAVGASLAGANPNQVNVSALGDGTTWNALDYIIRTGASDLVTQLAVLNSQLWIFGEKSIEIWYNAGNPNFPFARIQGATIDLGLMARGSIVKFYNTVIWLGADDRGYAQVYMSKGTSPVRISNSSIEGLLGLSTLANPTGNGPQLSAAWAYGYQEAGHTFYVLNLTDSSNRPLNAYVYDLNTGLWHERIWGNAGPAPTCCASVPLFNGDGPIYVGDGWSGKVLSQSLGYPSDLGSSINYQRTAPHVCDRNEWLRHGRLEIDGDFGTASPTLDYSNDGGRTFGGKSIVMRQAADLGSPTAIPTFRRFYAQQLGRSRDRVYKVTIIDSANLIRIAGAYLDVEA